MHASFVLDRPLDVGLTLAPIGAGPWIKVDGGEAWFAGHTPAGPATVHVAAGGAVLEAEAWGPGTAWAVEHAPVLCGELDDERSFRPRHAVLADLHRRHAGMRVPRTHSVFDALMPAVLAQQVTSTEARASYREIVYSFGEPAPGPVSLVVPPSPRVLARMPYWTFHRFGVERRRADVILRAARSANRLEETAAMPLPDAYRRLLAFPGVGPWTAAKVANVALGDADAVPVGDYNIPHMVGFAFEGTPRSTDDRMLELLAPFAGHRARVIRLLMLAGIVAPRFGPRRPLRAIQRN